jgi:lipopolysaccharide transport system permease protein
MKMVAFLKVFKHKDLIYQFVKRDLASKYKGSLLGTMWSFLVPFIMLTIYTFVFSVIFKAKWGKGDENIFTFGLTLFAGFIVYTIFAEVVTRSTTIITNNPNYVKKVVFPLEIFPVVLLGVSMINASISVLILCAFYFIIHFTLHWTVIFVPIVLLPVVLLSLGFGWFFAATGVFVRDIGHVVGLAVQVLMFLSPVFYPISAVPSYFQPIYTLNPLGIVMEEMRRVVLSGEMPYWDNWTMVALISFIICIAGFSFFQRCKGAFADVV